MGEGKGGRRLRLRPSFRLGESSLRAGVLSEPEAGAERGASLRGMSPSGAEPAPEGEPLARRGVNHFFFPLTFTLLDMVFYLALLSRKRSI